MAKSLIDDYVTRAARELYSHDRVPDRYDADLLIAGFIDGQSWRLDLDAAALDTARGKLAQASDTLAEVRRTVQDPNISREQLRGRLLDVLDGGA